VAGYEARPKGARDICVGHEIAGTVAALGPNCTKLRVGDRVVVYPWLNVADHKQYKGAMGVIGYDGGFASHVLVPEEQFALRVAPTFALSDEELCLLACSGLTAYSAWKRADCPCENLIILGAGGVALQCVRIAETKNPIVVVDIDPKKLEAAAAVGKPGSVKTVLLGKDSAAALKQVAALLRPGERTSVIDFVSVTATLAFAMQVLFAATPKFTSQGLLVMVGLMAGDMPKLSSAQLIQRQISIVPSLVGTLAELQELLKLVERRPLKPFPIALRDLDHASVQKGMDELHQGSVVGRLVFRAKL